MDELREKCPWDKTQTIKTLRQQTIEETYELADEITGQNWQGIKEELGDLLLHIVFYSKIASEEQQFNLQDVIDAICDKLIKRHPHIYGDVIVENEEDVKRNWEQLKLKEGKISVFSGLPNTLPAMLKAMRIQEKAKKIGFDWKNKEDVWQKVEEEKGELLQAEQEGEEKEIEMEAGDLLFSVINYIRFLKIDPENALELTNKKFIKRFNDMERVAEEKGLKLPDMSLQQMDEIWDHLKKHDN